ncbi:GMC family oxidoreductase [Streptomyces sp. NBC_00385]|uniref:GMC family oxidoreductase n=1 Tax=Streptomyces sp. NBC_00385 TaxID=2975733 RepID=UPI002DD9A413|nr:GMC family oxidoreductase N-terminal domain-containing protein [Streptomyces sp. NBC_00385]WRZ01951.1 GMC family oxidoreductase N-terminal domain-containing protein [Streptomyces sp. NBC_00385]
MFDYVVVGAGSAGCVLADQLSRDPGTTVLLVEAGGPDRHPYLRIPKGVGKLFGDPSFSWHYRTRPVRPGGNPDMWVRGKVFGGSSSVNGMVYNRGSRPDWDALEALGNPGWGWDDVLPAFRSIEDNALGGTSTRGTGGPLHVSSVRDPDPLCDELIATGGALGLRTVKDLNEHEGERIGYAMATIKSGQRFSAARAFLHPARSRPNLTIASRTTATRVLFDGDKAVGVEVRRAEGEREEVRARREVILSLGSLNTPKLLQLSGVGPAEVLRAAGVDVRLDRRQVGGRLREHRCLALRFRLNADLGANRQLSTTVAQARTGAGYLLTRRGPLARPAYDVMAFLKSRPDVERPDAEVLLAPWSLGSLIPGKPAAVEREPGLSACAMVLKPSSEGSLAITSADPDAALDIDAGYFTSGHDRQVAADLFRRLREFFAADPIASRITRETFPGPAVHSDDDEGIVGSALDGGYCGFHAIGTCAMGPDPDDVTDSRMRVRGVENLRVVDASVLPVMVSGNLNGPVMAMAWKAAEYIREDG